MLHVVAVDDNPAELFLLREAVREVAAEFTIHPCRNSDSAREYLQRAVQDSPMRPHIILLDINMPGESGLELLVEIKRDELLRFLPVIMVSGSSNPRDVRKAYECHASCFIVKRMDAGAHIEALQQLFKFWSLTAQLPGQAAA